MYLLRANIHNHKHTYAEVWMQTDKCVGSYQPIGLLFWLCQCVAILMNFFLFVPPFQLIYNFHQPFKFKFYSKLVTNPHDA